MVQRKVVNGQLSTRGPIPGVKPAPGACSRALLVALSSAALGISLSGCLPNEPLPYSPNYSRITLADDAPTLPVKAPHKGHDGRVAGKGGGAQTVYAPDACITPDVTEQPLYLPPGCANNLNLQMMVERPGDLAQGRRPGPAAAAPTVRAAERYLYGATEEERKTGRVEPHESPAPPSSPQGTRPDTTR